MTTDDISMDPFLQRAQDGVAAFAADSDHFEKESDRDFSLLKKQLAEAHAELGDAAGDIASAAVEANAEIDDAVIELLLDEEAE